MADLLFFTDTCRSLITPEILASMGLSGLFESNPDTRIVDRDGPSGKAGALFGVSDDDVAFGYYPEKQTWIECKGYWLGYQNDQKPGPADLERSSMVAGDTVVLGDGHEWLIPKIRLYPAGTNLHQTFIKNSLVGFATKIIPSQLAVWELGCKVFDAMLNDAMTNGLVWEMCSTALALNYRVNDDVISAMELLSTENYQRVLWAIMDMDARIEALKKNTDQVTPNSGNGG